MTIENKSIKIIKKGNKAKQDKAKQNKQDKAKQNKQNKAKHHKQDKVYNVLDIINKNWQNKIIKQLIRDNLISNLKKCNIKYNEFFTDEILKNELKIIDNIIDNLNIENIDINMDINSEKHKLNKKNNNKKDKITNSEKKDKIISIKKKERNEHKDKERNEHKDKKNNELMKNKCLNFNSDLCNARVFDNKYIITSYNNKIVYGRQCKNKKKKNNLCSLHNKNPVHGLFNKEPDIIIKKHFEKEFESKNNYMFVYLK